MAGRCWRPQTRKGEKRRGENAERTLLLYFRNREPGPDRETALSIADYVHANSKQGRRVTSTTWNGLKKKSDAWHRQRRQERAEATRHRQENQNEASKDICWNSLVGEMKSNGLTASPVVSRTGLAEEANAMGHCVDEYWERCAAGACRIFSITKGSRRVATGEISRRRNRWKPRQTLGRKNADPGTRARQVMEKVAANYQRAWENQQKPSPHGSARGSKDGGNPPGPRPVRD